MSSGRSIAVLSVVWLGLIPCRAYAGPLSFYTQPAMDSGQAAFVARSAVDFAPDGPAPERADETTGVLSMTAMVGVASWLTVAVTGSVLGRRSEVSLPTGDVATRDTRGVGDSGALVLVPFALSGSLDVTPFAGLEAPTGEDDESDELGRLPQRLQRGLGAWTALAGVLVSSRGAAHEIDVSASYFARSEANQFDAGDELRGELSARGCVVPWNRCAPSSVRLLPVMESRITWQRADAGRLAPAQSGGATWSLIPGVQSIIGRHVAELAVEVPLVQPADRHSAVVVRLGYQVRFAWW